MIEDRDNEQSALLSWERSFNHPCLSPADRHNVAVVEHDDDDDLDGDDDEEDGWEKFFI